MNSNNVEVMVTMEDRATGQMNSLTQAVRNNQTAFSDLAMGATFMGTALIGMASAMEKSNSETIKGLGSTLSLVGGIMSAVGAATYFVYSVGKMVEALKALNIMLAIRNALQGPTGWAVLGGAAIVGAGAIYGISKVTSGGSGGGGRSETTNVTVHQHIAGSVVTEKQLVDSVQKGLVLKGQRNAGTGIQ